MSTRLIDHTVLITGANNPLGIGAAIGQRFAGEGARLALTYMRLASPEAGRSDTPGLAYYNQQRAKPADEVLASIANAGGSAIAQEFDLGDEQSATTLFDWAEGQLGSVDILVNNAAHYEEERDTIFDITSKAVDRTFDVNVRAAILLTKEFVVRHRRRGASWGRIINLSTDAAHHSPGKSATARARPQSRL